MACWNLVSIQELLQNNSYAVITQERLSNDSGWKLTCAGGEIICVYDSGKVVAQGKNQSAVRALLGQMPPNTTNGASMKLLPNGNRNVFVVYGHDIAARTELEAMLRRWGLTPLILDQLTSGGQTIIEKLERVRNEAGFAVVLATPDDEGHRATHPEEKAYRARQNVVLEMGMMLSILGRERVAILLKKQNDMERPSDINGLIYIPFHEKVSEIALSLAKEINARGIPIDLDKV